MVRKANNSDDELKLKAQKAQDRSQSYINASRNVILASKVLRASNFFTRFKGLLGTSKLDSGCGLVIEPCSQIHMFWMTYAIDVVFIDKAGVVVGLTERIKPWHVSRMFSRARFCLELPEGTISDTGTEIGDIVLVQ